MRYPVRACELVRPENRVDTKFVHLVDEHGQIMTEHLTKCFVGHRNVGLAAKRVSKFPFHHRERFDIRLFVDRPSSYRGREGFVGKATVRGFPAKGAPDARDGNV